MYNLSSFRQGVRITIGLILIATAWMGPYSSIAIIDINIWSLGWLGFIPLFSGISAFCPIYAVLGYDHQKNQKNKTT